MNLQKPPKTTTGIAIRELLRKTQPNYVYALWHNLCMEKKLTCMRYASFCSYFKTLERLGLVIRSKPPKVEPPVPLYRKKYHFKSTPRAWYTLNFEKLSSPEWRYPQRALRPQIFLLTHRPKGRPPGSRNKPKT